MKTHTYHCSKCGQEVKSKGLAADEVMHCPEHPGARIDSVLHTKGKRKQTALDAQRYAAQKDWEGEE